MSATARDSPTLTRSSQQLAAHAIQHIIASAWTRESAGEIRNLNNLIANPEFSALLQQYDDIAVAGTLSTHPVASNATEAAESVLQELRMRRVAGPDVDAPLRELLESAGFQALLQAHDALAEPEQASPPRDRRHSSSSLGSVGRSSLDSSRLGGSLASISSDSTGPHSNRHGGPADQRMVTLRKTGSSLVSRG